MGGKYSTIQDSRAPIVTVRSAAPTSHPSAYNNPPRRWSSNNFPENGAAAACTTYAPGNCNPNYKGYNTFPATNKTSASGGNGVVFPLKVANTKEVIAFHSSTKWREYFEASKQSNNLVVMYFTATWCGPCRYMEPTIKELAAKYSEIDIVKIDVDELFNVSREFGVQTMPTFLFMKKGVQIDKVTGARKDDFQKKVEKHRA